MDTLRATYDDTDNSSNTTTINALPDIPELPPTATVDTDIEPPNDTKNSPIASEDLSDLDPKDDSLNFTKPSSSSSDPDAAVLADDDDLNPPPHKKQKHLSELPEPDPHSTTPIQPSPKAAVTSASSKKKKSKSKNSNVWTKPTSRKGKKKNKSNTITTNTKTVQDTVLISPVPRFPDKNDDSADANICLSKVYKAEKVELSEDRMSAGSCKGYRMVRATRGVMEGAWYFEIRVVKLGETGHTRLGWSNEKGDLQAPVGYDGNSFGYRDVDGSKVHKALREKYGEKGYVEGDVIGFYISLPEGNAYAPKPPRLVWHKGQRYVLAPDANEDPPKVVPGSEISFFRNGICQGVAFKDLFGGRYYPAASMYTLPNQPNCMVKFNFGPDFEAFPEDFGGRPLPKPMIEVPYRGFDGSAENGVSNEKKH